MAPSQKSAENFHKKLAAKAKRGIVSSGAAGMGKSVDPKELKPKELPCPYCERMFKQQDRLKQHIARHHAEEIEQTAGEVDSVVPGSGGGNRHGSHRDCKKADAAQATVFHTSLKDPKTILQEYVSKKKTTKKPRYNIREEPNGAGYTCKVVLPDKYKPDNDIVIFSSEACATKDEAMQRSAVLALARVANNLPLQRLLPPMYKQLFAELEEKEREKNAKAKHDAAERERRSKFRPKERELQTLHMSEDKRNLVENLLREIEVEGHSRENAGGDGDIHRDGRTFDVQDVTAKLQTFGFELSDVEAALHATQGIGTHGLDRSDVALDWLCLNVPEAKLPRRFAPNAKSEPIVLLDTAAMFASAESFVTSATTDNFRSEPLSCKEPVKVSNMENERPEDPSIAWLWDRGYAQNEAKRALEIGDNNCSAALINLFRDVLQSGHDENQKWKTWPTVRHSDEGSNTEEDEAWDDEMVAVEAIFGENVVSRPSSDRIEIIINTSLGEVILDVMRTPGKGYPSKEPPLISIVEKNGHSIPHALLRSTTVLLAAEAIAAAADGMPCIHSLAELIQSTFADQKSGLTAPEDLRQTQSSADVGDTDCISACEVVQGGVVVSQDASGLDCTSSGSTSNESRIIKRTKGSDYMPTSSDDFVARENFRLKAKQEKYFSSVKNGGAAELSAAAKMVATRAHLPASRSREEVTSAVSSTQVVVLSGETGCGKSTQVPQFLLEHAISAGTGGACNIICTQPRRISAIGLAERVAAERLEICGDVVGYSVRLESKLSKRTRLHFCTMGVLLRKMLSDPLLRGLTHVVLDEVHERSVESDLLLLLLRRLLLKRSDIRLVLMSATADAGFFADYFSKPNTQSRLSGVLPIESTKVFIQGFTYPVCEYFLEDVFEMTGFLVGKTSKWAKRKNAGGIVERTAVNLPVSKHEELLTSDGKTEEIVPESWEEDEERMQMCDVKRGQVHAGTSHEDNMYEGDTNHAVEDWIKPDQSDSTDDDDLKKALEADRICQDRVAEASKLLLGYSESTQRSVANVDESLINYELIEQLIGKIIRIERESGEAALVAKSAGDSTSHSRQTLSQLGAILIFLPGQAEIMRLIRSCAKSRYLEQSDVGSLLLLPLYGALSSDDQRRIFARPPPGVRKLIFATNIAETSVTVDDVRYVIDTVRAKEMRYDASRGLSVLTDTWISRAASKQRRGRAGRTSPGAWFTLCSRQQHAKLIEHQPPEMLRTPLQQLCLSIKALAPHGSIAETLASAPTPPLQSSVDSALCELVSLRALDAKSEDLTPLGHNLAHMPVDARIGKMLVFGALLGCLDPILTIAASMSGRSIFVSPKDAKAEADAARRRLAAPGKSDHLTMASVYSAWYRSGKGAAQRRFCEKNFLSQQGLEAVQTSRHDYANVLVDLGFIPRNYLENMRRDGAGGGDPDRNAKISRVVKAALVAGFYPQLVRVQHPETKFMQTSGGTVEKESAGRDVKFYCRDIGRVFLHPSSVNLQVGKFESPWLVFSERVETAKVYIRDNTMVGAYALLLFGGELKVDHEKGKLSVDDGLAQFNAPARIGVLVRELRAAVDRLLEQRISQPVREGEISPLSASPVVRALLELLATEGL